MTHRTHPTLAEVDPHAAKDTLGFAVLNMVLGVSLYFVQSKTNYLFLINDVFTYQVWGVIFASTGIASLVAYIINFWAWMRYLQIVGLIIKSSWMLALVIRQIINPDTNLILLTMFSALAWFQFSLYLHFPVLKKGERWKR